MDRVKTMRPDSSRPGQEVHKRLHTHTHTHTHTFLDSENLSEALLDRFIYGHQLFVTIKQLKLRMIKTLPVS